MNELVVGDLVIFKTHRGIWYVISTDEKGVSCSLKYSTNGTPFLGNKITSFSIFNKVYKIYSKQEKIILKLKT